MNVDAIIQRLDDLGISMQVREGRLELRPGSRVPKDLQTEVRRHKIDLLGKLDPIQTVAPELEEILNGVRENGFVLLWSNVLRDTVAFAHNLDGEYPIPNGFTVYDLNELMLLFGDSQPSAADLHRIHQVKRHGGRVIDDQ